MRKKESAET